MRLVAIGLTLAVALTVLVALSLVLVGPTVAEKLGQTTGWGAPFKWTWLIVQWPLVFLLVTTGIGLLYYFGPDAEQDWVWITPGAVAATTLWLLVSLAFKLYVARFTDYEGSYGAVGAVIVVLLWFYVSGIAILTGAELNAEIEHASPLRKSSRSEERTRKAPAWRTGGASVPSAPACRRTRTRPACAAAAAAEGWIRCGGCGRALGDEVVEASCDCRIDADDVVVTAVVTASRRAPFGCSTNRPARPKRAAGAS